MKIEKTKFKDVFIILGERFNDERGFFEEVFNYKKFREAIGFDGVFVQDNHSYSYKNVLRGLHYQIKHPQGKLVRCVSGNIVDVIVDLRKQSPTFGKFETFQLNATSSIHLWVPPGFAHGFYVKSMYAEVTYKTTDYYYEEYSRTLIWNDPRLDLSWEVEGNPILSEKDRLGKTFDECEKYDIM
jgi:dTDP-4-dehydrorhamnose 3,5-epimerase